MFSARAPGYVERSDRVVVAAGETKNVELQLQREQVAQKQAPPAARSFGMADWDQPWSEQGDVWVRRGGGFVSFKPSPIRGIVTMTVHAQRGWGALGRRRIRWAANYVDDKNLLRFELSNKEFFAYEVVNGKQTETGKTAHEIRDPKSFTMQVEIGPSHVIHRLFRNGQWVVMDNFTAANRNLTEGKFGFIIPGNEEVGLSDFKFTAR
jgi:hypothetical protein